MIVCDVCGKKAMHRGIPLRLDWTTMGTFDLCNVCKTNLSKQLMDVVRAFKFSRKKVEEL